MLDKNIFNNFLSDSLKDFDPDKEKAKILSNPWVLKLIKNFNLSDTQIDKNMNLLQKYFDYVEKQNEVPHWKIYLDQYSNLIIDFTNGKSFTKQKMLNNFWLTNITPLDADLESYFCNPNKIKPKRISQEANKALLFFNKKLNEELNKIISSGQYSKGLFLVDEQMKFSKSILLYLSIIFATNKDKTVVFIDETMLYSYFYQNSKNPEAIKNIIYALTTVNYLFIVNFTSNLRPEWYINSLINVFSARSDKQKPFFISSIIDITNNNSNIIYCYKNNNNLGLKKLEMLFKKLIANSTIKFIAS
ncbi:hypothetical protein [Metamycoplasma equirhinis]|uniref:hypothetical protein n=1 Tax=Metamycoplasma equirhinis TaxID=92402 RepID=UPI0035935CD5